MARLSKAATAAKLAAGAPVIARKRTPKMHVGEGQSATLEALRMAVDDVAGGHVLPEKLVDALRDYAREKQDAIDRSLVAQIVHLFMKKGASLERALVMTADEFKGRLGGTRNIERLFYSQVRQDEDQRGVRKAKPGIPKSKVKK